MTRDEAAVIVSEHLRWLETNDKSTVADALKRLLSEVAVTEPALEDHCRAVEDAVRKGFHGP